MDVDDKVEDIRRRLLSMRRGASVIERSFGEVDQLRVFPIQSLRLSANPDHFSIEVELGEGGTEEDNYMFLGLCKTHMNFRNKPPIPHSVWLWRYSSSPYPEFDLVFYDNTRQVGTLKVFFSRVPNSLEEFVRNDFNNVAINNMGGVKMGG